MARLSYREIQQLLPHRHPMLLIDQVSAIEAGTSIVATKAISANEPCFDPSADGAALAYPCSLIVESFCQAAGVLCNVSRQAAGQNVDGLMLFGSITNYDFEGEAFPGDILEHRAQLDVQLPDAAVLSGETWVGERCLARVERIVVALRPADALAA